MFILCVITCFTALSLADAVFRQVSNTGTGCIPGSVLTSTAPNDQNSTNLIHTLEHFAVRIGGNISASEDRLNCTVYTHVSFTEPRQRLYLNMDRGHISAYLEIDKGVQVTFKASYNWVVEGFESGGTEEYFRGPIYGRFDRPFAAYVNDGEVLGPCGGGILQTMYKIRAIRVGPEEEVQTPETPEDVS